ncbi:MAG: sel1 repeat family protein [Comamonadaceae bacterium]|nr:sel1 repeat family protein [Comamonadaceae bacterium]
MSQEQTRPNQTAAMQPGPQRQRRGLALAAACLGAASWCWAQPQLEAPPPPAQASTTHSHAARYVQACQEALDKGQPGLGCSGALFHNELRELQAQALQSQSPALMALVGDAYRNERSPMADIGQAYRWYLMAAVRGDAAAMERLSRMYHKGQGVAADPVKALGYARLTQQFAAAQGQRSGRDVARLIQSLGSQMAAEELALSERFAQEMGAAIASGKPRAQGAEAAHASPMPGAAAVQADPADRAAPVSAEVSIPGLRQGSMATTAEPEPGAPPPGQKSSAP